MFKRLLLICLLCVPAGVVAAPPTSSADALITESLRAIAAMVADCRLPLATDPLALRGVVDQHLRPKADVLYAGQVILGRHWSEADPEQRRRFAEALYGTLATRYASGLLLLTDRNVTVVPGAAAIRDGEATVELRVQATLATPIPVFVQMRWSGERWRIYDARWEGQSYILSLRHAFSQEIRRDGLEAVIRRLEASAGTPPGAPAARDTAAGRCLRARGG